MGKKSLDLNLAAFTGVMKTGARVAAPDAEIALYLIDIVEQVRSELGDLTEIVESVRNQGVFQPVLLLDLENGRYRLIAGERRYRASEIAGKATIPAVIKRGLTAKQIRSMQVQENQERQGLSAYDEAIGVAKDVDQFGVDGAIEIWNRSEPWVSKRVSVVTYADPVRILFRERLCGDLEVLHSLNQLHSLDKDEYLHMENKLRDGGLVSREEARDKVSTIKAHKKQASQAKPKKVEREKVPEAPVVDTGSAPSDTLIVASENTHAMAPARKPAAEPPAALPVKTSEATEASALAQDTSDDAQLQALRAALYEAGLAQGVQIERIKAEAFDLGCNLNETEWVLSTAFQTATLPLLIALQGRAIPYLRRLMIALKTQDPQQAWQALHPVDPASQGHQKGRGLPVPPMPVGWRF